MLRDIVVHQRDLYDVPDFNDRILSASHAPGCFTPPPSRASDTLDQATHTGWHEAHFDRGTLSLRENITVKTKAYLSSQEASFFERNDDTFEGINFHRSARQDTSRTASGRHLDAYGIDYSSYQENLDSSPPQTPGDTRSSIDWTETAEPIISNTFRRHSLVLDPSAFDSTPSVDLLPQPQASKTLRLRRSADHLKEIGKRILPRLRLGKKSADTGNLVSNDMTPCTEEYMLSLGPLTTTSYISSRTRSNTLESTRSSRSMRSKRSSSQLTSSTPWNSEHKLVSVQHMAREAHDTVTDDLGVQQQRWEADIQAVSDPTCASTLKPCNSPVPHSDPPPSSVETGRPRAPAISAIIPCILPAYDATDPVLEDILKQMQEDDEAFLQTEMNMRKSGWSSKYDIEQVSLRRQENRNLWQRRLDNALDSLRATES